MRLWYISLVRRIILNQKSNCDIRVLPILCKIAADKSCTKFLFMHEIGCGKVHKPWVLFPHPISSRCKFCQSLDPDQKMLEARTNTNPIFMSQL
jgi:hypothetical protein